MGIVELDPIIRIKLIIFLANYLALTFIFRYFMRNYLKVKKREGFFRKYVNSQHQKVTSILTVSVIVLLIGVYFYETRSISGSDSFITTGIILLASIAVSELIRAYMEWKYSKNRTAYILTLSELLFSIVILAIAFTGNTFGLFR